MTSCPLSYLQTTPSAHTAPVGVRASTRDVWKNTDSIPSSGADAGGDGLVMRTVWGMKVTRGGSGLDEPIAGWAGGGGETVLP